MENWAQIKNFEEYQISNTGKVKSLKFGKEKLLTLNEDKQGYLHVLLSKNNKKTIFKVHKLVAIHFLNHIPDGYNLVINHIDYNKHNNNVSNLEIVTQRVNSFKKDLKSTSSKYTGVYWNKQRNKWKAQIYLNGKRKHLGLFENEEDAHKAYQNALLN